MSDSTAVDRKPFQCVGGPWDGMEVAHKGQAFPVRRGLPVGACGCDHDDRELDGYYLLTPKNDMSAMIWRWSFRLPAGFEPHYLP